MSDVSIITNDEIMEMTQLVFDRYYTELKRQLRRAEIPAEDAERYCTEILSKVYQALQTQGVAATSYELDACAIPIINDEVRKILVPLHLNGYRNLRENPITEPQVDTEPEPVQPVSVHKEEMTEIKKESVQVVSNGEVQVYPETAEEELNPELRMEIRRILQQEFQLEPAQVKPVVVVVNVAAPQAPVQAEAPVHIVKQTEEGTCAVPIQEEVCTEESQEDIPVQEEPQKQEPAQTVEVIEFEQGKEKRYHIAASEVAAALNGETVEEVVTVQKTAEADQEPLPELDFDLEKLAQDETEAAGKKEKKHMWLWIPIIVLLLVLLWLTAGMLMSYDIVPDVNLGYEWFNEAIFELF